MARLSVTLDGTTNKLLRILAIEQNTSPNDIVRELIKTRVNRDSEILSRYYKMIGENLGND